MTPNSPQIAVITPLREPDVSYLLDSYHDLVNQTVVRWRWYLQWDGPEATALPREIERDPRVSFDETSRSFGAGSARNLALAASSDDEQFVYAHDYDDRLEPWAFQALLKPFSDHPALGWTAGYFGDYVQIDGVWHKRQLEYSVEPGAIPVGAWAAERADGVPFLPAHSSLMWRKDVVFALGGWGALPYSEDNFLAHAAQNLFPGFLVYEQTGWFRKHPAQSANARGTEVVKERQLSKRFVDQRERAIKRLSGSQSG
jgi:glycosyltransferase involved in cell wall biosynthesis